MNNAGIRVTQYGFFSLAKYTVSVHNVKTESVWLLQPKYCHIVLNPSGFSTCHSSIPKLHKNKGTQMISRLAMGRWSSFSHSATISRALRRAVSPEVIGAATTPSMARTAPASPSQSLQTRFTTAGADVWKPSVAAAIRA